MFQIIPAIDLINWEVVRLIKWNYNEKTIYIKAALEVAIYLEKIWFTDLHVVNLVWAKQWGLQENATLKNIARSTELSIDFGGWIRNKADIKKIQDIGVKYINIGSLAIEDREKMKRLLQEFWAENFSIWIDVIWEYCYTQWWTQRSNNTYREILEFYKELWVKRFNVTSIANDGMLSGINVELYRQIISEFPTLEIIASWWTKDVADIVLAQEIWCSGIIIWKAFYEKKINLENLLNKICYKKG